MDAISSDGCNSKGFGPSLHLFMEAFAIEDIRHKKWAQNLFKCLH